MDEWPIRITLPGEPVGKGRPRVRVMQYGVKRPFPQLYKDTRTRDYEKALGTMAVLAMRGREPIAGPVHLIVTAYFGIPKSWSDKKSRMAAEGTVRPTGKPDWDNISKCCCDALNKIVWNDDAQIVSASVRKVYSDAPGLEIEISPV